MIERQELHCHECDKYVQFDIDTSLNGNHVLRCPSCGHEHCRVVSNGIITGDRWDTRNDIRHTISASSITFTQTSTYTFYSNAPSMATSGTSASVFLYGSWMNSTSAR